MRMILSRPVTRLRILALKYLATVLYTTLLAFFIGLTSLAAGFLYERPGGFFVFGMVEHIYAFHEFWPGLMRYFAILPMLVLSLLTVNATAFFLSCLNMKPAAATICTLTIFFVDYVFRSLPFFESLEPYFIATRLGTWMQVFERDIPWPHIWEDYTVLLAVDATLFVLGWLSFERRDFKA
jgi:ABC-2 type transport system permease protein